jgi:hypothetical protein
VKAFTSIRRCYRVYAFPIKIFIETPGKKKILKHGQDVIHVINPNLEWYRESEDFDNPAKRMKLKIYKDSANALLDKVGIKTKPEGIEP